MGKSLYKVVLEKDGCLVSAMGEHLDEVTVRYQVGEWSKPSIEGSKLYCFNRLAEARAFVQEFPKLRLRVFRCKAKNHEAGKYHVSSCLDPMSILWFWGRAPRPAFYFEGTRYCVRADEIMLVKEVGQK